MTHQASVWLLKAAAEENLKLLQQKEDMVAEARLKRDQEEAQGGGAKLKEEQRQRFQDDKQKRREEKERRKQEKDLVSLLQLAWPGLGEQPHWSTFFFYFIFLDRRAEANLPFEFYVFNSNKNIFAS